MLLPGVLPFLKHRYHPVSPKMRRHHNAERHVGANGAYNGGEEQHRNDLVASINDSLLFLDHYLAAEPQRQHAGQYGNRTGGNANHNHTDNCPT